MKLINHMVFY